MLSMGWKVEYPLVGPRVGEAGAPGPTPLGSVTLDHEIVNGSRRAEPAAGESGTGAAGAADPGELQAPTRIARARGAEARRRSTVFPLRWWRPSPHFEP